MAEEVVPATPQPAEPDEDLLPQLMAVLTARWRDENGRLGVGAPRRRLLEALRMDEVQLEALLQRLAERAAVLGLELRDYKRTGDTWCCLTAIHGGPTELTEVEQGVLGLIIHLVHKSGRRRYAPADAIREILVGREYLSEHQLQNVLRRLEYHGYVRRSRGTVALDCRTTLEFDEHARKEIADQAKLLIL